MPKSAPNGADSVCLYKGTEARIFSAENVEDAMRDGWADAPGGKSGTEAEQPAPEPRRRGRPPKAAE